MNEANFVSVLETLSNYMDEAILSDWFIRNYYLTSPNSLFGTERSAAEFFTNFSGLNEVEYKFKRILFSLEEMLQLSTMAGPNFTSDIPQEGICCNHVGLVEDDIFIDYYKSHIILQVVTFNRIHKKHDTILAMLCTLFFKYSRFTEDISVSQIIARKKYYTMAEYILTGYTTHYETDHFLKIKLATLLIKKELQLSGDYCHKLNRFCVNREIVPGCVTLCYPEIRNVFNMFRSGIKSASV